MQHFLMYAAKLNPWFPHPVIPFVGAVITIVESVLGISLLVGFQTRRAARVSGWLVLAFGIGMTGGTGFKSALNASVFAFSGGAWLLAAGREYPVSVDALTRTAPDGHLPCSAHEPQRQARGVRHSSRTRPTGTE
jgi:hypothetical protein